MRRVLSVLGGMMTAVLVLVMAASVTLTLSARRSGDGIPTVLGHKVLTVVSGSMEPTIRTGDAIIIRPLAPGDTVAENDIITFRTQDMPEMLVTHRVVGTVRVNGRPAAFITKGDANESEDLSAVEPDQIVGRYRWRVPYFGYVSTFVRRPAGLALLVLVPGLILIGLEIHRLWRILSEPGAPSRPAGTPEAAEPEPAGRAGREL